MVLDIDINAKSPVKLKTDVSFDNKFIESQLIGGEGANASVFFDFISHVGIDGKSAYQYAVENGYVGTESEFAADMAKVANNLRDKADLDPVTRTILPSQLNPLLGRQTAANTKYGYYYSNDPALIPITNSTFEFWFKLDEDVTTSQFIFSCRPGGVTNFGMSVGGNKLVVWYANGNNVFKVNSGQYCHLIFSNTIEGSSVLYNGIPSYIPKNSLNDSLAFILGGLSSAYFKGSIIHCRKFNYAMGAEEALLLWNNGRPQDVTVSSTTTDEHGCIAEYKPYGLLADRWRDTSQGVHDLLPIGRIVLDYRLHEFRKIILGKDSPVEKPDYIGQLYVDTGSSNVFVSASHIDITGWKLINQ